MKSLKEIVKLALTEKEIQFGKQDLQAIKGFIMVLAVLVCVTCFLVVLGA